VASLSANWGYISNNIYDRRFHSVKRPYDLYVSTGNYGIKDNWATINRPSQNLLGISLTSLMLVPRVWLLRARGFKLVVSVT
jgi:hypothetical protein